MYYQICLDDDGGSIQELREDDLAGVLEDFEEPIQVLNDSRAMSKALAEKKTLSHADLLEIGLGLSAGFIIIKGEILMPKDIKTVTEYENE